MTNLAISKDSPCYDFISTSLRIYMDFRVLICYDYIMVWEKEGRKWQLTSVFLPGESQGQRSLVGCHLWGHTESDTTEVTQQQRQEQHIMFYSVDTLKFTNSYCCLVLLSLFALLLYFHQDKFPALRYLGQSAYHFYGSCHLFRLLPF